MSTVKNWSELVSAIKKQTADAMQKEVFETVREVYQSHIKSDVYDTYSPTVYEQRGSNGGLMDADNIIGQMNGDTLEVLNVASPSTSIADPPTPYIPDNQTKFAEWIEYGQAYNGGARSLFPRDMSSEPWAQPREFTANTINDLKSNKQHLKALAEGLRRAGAKLK